MWLYYIYCFVKGVGVLIIFDYIKYTALNISIYNIVEAKYDKRKQAPAVRKGRGYFPEVVGEIVAYFP